MACAVWPEDGKPYIYSNLEPFECHRILPCFDQPDLKAVLALTVTAPADWVVVANAADESKKTETVSVRVCVCGVRLGCVWGVERPVPYVGLLAAYCFCLVHPSEFWRTMTSCVEGRTR